MSQKPNKEEMKQCLKDANLYEENMSHHMMIEYYKVIKNSESFQHEEDEPTPLDDSEKSLNDSANELMEAINNSESVAPSYKKENDTFSVSRSDDESLDAFSQDILHRAKSRIKDEEETNNNNNNINKVKQEKNFESELILDINKIGFNDMPKSDTSGKNMLKIIHHELKYVNIQNSEKFLQASSATRIQMLSNYHLAMAKLKAHYASLSTKMAPMGKPITAIDSDLCVNPVISSLKDEELSLIGETTYVSRSGRLTKRKVYNEYDESSQESCGISKKLKNDDEWHSDNPAKVSKITLKTKEFTDKNVNNHTPTGKASGKPVIARSESPDSSQNDPIVTDIKVEKFDELKENASFVLKPRTYQRRQLSNDEIMSRSSLFRDANTLKKGRTEALLNAAREETKKKKQQEDEVERFANSLDSDSQALDDESRKIIVDDDDEVIFERKRIIPPLPSSRRCINGRKRGGATGPAPLNISTRKPNLNASVEEINSSTLVNGVGRRNAPRRASMNNRESKGEPSSSSNFRGKKEVVMLPCPLCMVSFPQKEIEEHAATCGEDMFAQTPQPKLARITCEICDLVVPLTTDYEVHVKECIARKNGV